MNKSLYILILLSAIFSCKKEVAPYGNDDLQVLNSQPVNDSLKQYFLYQPGTWWVYRNTSTNSRASIYIYSTTFSVYTYTAPPSGPGQGPRNYYYNYEMVLGGNTHESNRYYLFGSIFENHYSFPYEYSRIFGYTGENDSLVLDFNRLDYFDSIFIQNRWYYDVAKTKLYTMYHSCCPIPDLHIFYINKEYGIIKKEIANPVDSSYTIYELVNSNIVR